VRDKDLWAHVLRDYGLVREDAGEAPRERSEPEGEKDEGLLEIEGKASEGGGGKKKR
jgi:hypothetical protein